MALQGSYNRRFANELYRYFPDNRCAKHLIHLTANARIIAIIDVGIRSQKEEF